VAETAAKQRLHDLEKCRRVKEMYAAAIYMINSNKNMILYLCVSRSVPLPAKDIRLEKITINIIKSIIKSITELPPTVAAVFDIPREDISYFMMNVLDILKAQNIIAKARRETRQLVVSDEIITTTGSTL